MPTGGFLYNRTNKLQHSQQDAAQMEFSVVGEPNGWDLTQAGWKVEGKINPHWRHFQIMHNCGAV